MQPIDTNNTILAYNKVNINTKPLHNKTIIEQSSTSDISSNIALTTANISHIPFTLEEYKLAIYFKNAGKIEDLSDEQLIFLSKIYKFSQEDFIALKNKTDFINYVLQTKIVGSFHDLPKIVQYEPSVAISALQTTSDYSIIKYIPKEYQTQNMCNLAFKYYGGNLTYFNDSFKTYEMCIEYIESCISIDISLIPIKFRTDDLYKCIIKKVISDNYRFNVYQINDNRIKSIELLPIELLRENPNIVLYACICDTSTIVKLPSELITENLILTFVTTLIQHMELQDLNLESLLSKIKKLCCSEENGFIIDSYFNKYSKQLNQIKSIQQVNKQIDTKNDTKQSFTAQQWISQHNSDTNKKLDYKSLPEELKADTSIIKYILKRSTSNINFIDKKYLTKEICHEIFVSYIEDSPSKVDTRVYLDIIFSKCIFIKKTPIDCRSLTMWFYICTRDNRKHINDIPNKIVTKEFLTSLIDEYVQWNNKFDLYFIENLFSFELFDDNMKNKILANCLQVASRFSTIIFLIFKSTKIPKSFKDEFWQNIITGNLQFPEIVIEDLYSKVNPLQRSIPAPAAAELLSSCYKFNNPNDLNLSDIAQELNNYINSSQQEKLPINNTVDVFENAKVKGGRTIQVDISDSTANFYKFRKKNETLESFTKEACFLEFLEKTASGKLLKQQLKSDIPLIIKLVSMPVSQLPSCAFRCEDDLDIYVYEDVQYVDVIVFKCSKDYLEYAHKQDTKNPENIFLKAEEGLKKACFDLGIFAVHGIYYTNTLPAYHEGIKDRDWTALHMLLRKMSQKTVRNFFDMNERNDITMTGKLEAWNTTATERPDYGYTGLRDFGDFEIFGNITSTLNRAGCQDIKLFHSIVQKILVANTICETLLATILLYARLHNQFPDYHYKNIQCRKHTSDFIENIFANFLSGRIQKETVDLQEFMELSTEDYKKWLERIVTEVLYWTAKQPTKKQLGTNKANFYSEEIDITDCFSFHVNQGKLPLELYDDFNTDEDIKYPKLFVDGMHHHLGRVNGTFPLLSLLNFLFLFNSRLNKFTVCHYLSQDTREDIAKKKA